MPRQIVYGAGTAAGGQALGAGLQGMTQGMAIGQEIAHARASLRQKRFQTALAQKEAALVEEQRKAQQEWDTLRAAGMEGFDSIEDVPPLQQADDGQTEIPGVRARPVGLTAEELAIFPRLSPEARQQVIAEKERERTAAHFEAMAQNLRGRAMAMATPGGPYSGQSGLMPPQAAELAAQAEMIAEGFEVGALTGAQAHAAMSRLSDALIEATGEVEANLFAIQELRGAMETAYAEGRIEDYEFIQEIQKGLLNGRIPAQAARAAAGLGKDNADAYAAWVLSQAAPAQGTLEGQGGLQVHRPGSNGVAPPQGVPRGTAPPRTAPADEERGPDFVSDAELDAADPSYEMSPALKAFESGPRVDWTQKQMAMNGVLDIIAAMKSRDHAGVNRILDTLAKNPRDRTIFGNLAAELSNTEKFSGFDRKKTTQKQRSAVRSAIAVAFRRQRDVAKTAKEPPKPGEELGLEGQMVTNPEEPPVVGESPGERAGLPKKPRGKVKRDSPEEVQRKLRDLGQSGP